VKSVRSDDGAGALVVVVDEEVVDEEAELDAPVFGAAGADGVLEVAVLPFPALTPLVHPAARAAAKTTAPVMWVFRTPPRWHTRCMAPAQHLCSTRASRRPFGSALRDQKKLSAAARSCSRFEGLPPYRK